MQNHNIVSGYKELIHSVAHQEPDAQERREVLDFIDSNMNAFVEYANSIAASEVAIASIRFRKEGEELREAVMSMDRNRRLKHDNAIAAVATLKNIADHYQVPSPVPFSYQDYEYQDAIPDPYKNSDFRQRVEDFSLQITQEFFKEQAIRQIAHELYLPEPDPEFRTVDAKEYAGQMQFNFQQPVTARNKSCVLAKVSVPGELLQTWNQDGTLKTEERGKAGYFTLTECYSDGSPVTDAGGHVNQWQTDTAELQQNYQTDSLLQTDPRQADPQYGIFLKAQGKQQQFLQVPEDINIAVPQGECGEMITQNLPRGSWLNITNPNEIYGLSNEEFYRMYEMVPEQEITAQQDVDEVLEQAVLDGESLAGNSLEMCLMEQETEAPEEDMELS